MKAPQPEQVAKFLGSLAAVSLLNLPLLYYNRQNSFIFIYSVWLYAPFIIILLSEPLRGLDRFRGFFEHRSFDGLLLRSLATGAAIFGVNVLAAFIPNLGAPLLMAQAAFYWGFETALNTVAVYATIDHPHRTNRSYWTVTGTLFALAGGFGSFLWPKPHSLFRGAAAAAVYLLSLWVGLWLGNQIRGWINALKPIFSLVKRLLRVLVAYGAGYVAIILIFSTFYAAAYKWQGDLAFVSLATRPTFATFIYFSLVTATTVGYGDITPKSEFARIIAGAEILTALAWTLIVFAAVAVRFTDSRSNTKDD